MTRVLAVASLAIALLVSSWCFPVVADEGWSDPLEIRLPDEQYLHMYATRDYLPAEVYAGNAEAAFGGRWWIPIWDQYSNTARTVHGSGVEVAPEGITTAAKAESLALAIVSEHPALFGNAALANLRTHRVARAIGRWAVVFQQTLSDIPVADTVIRLLFTDSGRLVAFGTTFYDSLEAPTTAIVDVAEAENIARQAIDADTSFRFTSEPQTLILPLLDTSADPPAMDFHLVHRIDVPTRDGLSIYATYVDARTGTIVKRQNLVAAAYTGAVSADVEIQHPCDSLYLDIPLGELELQIGSNTYVVEGDGFEIGEGGNYEVRLKGPHGEAHTTPRTHPLGKWSAIAIDASTGAVSVCFQDYDEDALDLLYARKANGRWSMETVDTNGDAASPRDVGQYASIALYAGVPHVAYFQDDDSSTGRLRYAVRQGGIWTWDRETLEPPTALGDVHYGRHTSIQMAADGARIAYANVDSVEVCLAYQYDATWYFDIVDTTYGTGAFSSLALTSSDLPAIAYYDAGSDQLKYAERTNALDGSTGSWDIWTVDATNDVGRYAALVLDSDSPCITYYDASNGDLRYAYRPTALSWSTEAIDSADSVGQFSSLALEPDGTLHVAYYDATNKNLKHAVNSGSGWTPTTVDNSNNDVGQYCALALDADELPHIVYYDKDDEVLKHAWYTGSVWETETVVAQDAIVVGALVDGVPEDILFDQATTNLAEVDAFYAVDSMYHYFNEIDPENWVSADIDTIIVMVDRDNMAPGYSGFFTQPDIIYLRGADDGRLSRSRLGSQWLPHEYGHYVQFQLTGELFSEEYMKEGQAYICGSMFTTPEFWRIAREDCESDCASPNDCDCENSLTFPDDVIGEGGYTGARVVCGFNWRLRENIEGVANADSGRRHTARLWLGTLALAPYSGYTLPEQVADYWLLDDDNGNLQDDVPHGVEIQEAATTHGLDDIIWTNALFWESDSIASMDDGESTTISLALDYKTNAYVGYKRVIGISELYMVRSRVCGEWSTTVLGAAAGGNSISLANGPGGVVAAYEKIDGNDALFYVAEQEGGWAPELVTTGFAATPNGIDVTVDAGGDVHVCYRVEAGGSAELYYKRRTEGTWQSSTLIDDDASALASMVVLSDAAVPDSIVAISYTSGTDVMYAEWTTPSGWSSGIVEAIGETVTAAAVAFGADGTPHVVYAYDNVLRYAKGPAGSWTVESVDVAPDASMIRGQYATIALNGDGYPCIGYYDQYTGDLRYAERAAIGWTLDAVDRPGDVGKHCAMVRVAEGFGNPLIAYLDYRNGWIKLAEGAEPKTPSYRNSNVCIDVSQGTGFGPGDNESVVRLCPDGDYDALTLEFALLDILGNPVADVNFGFVELSGSVNLLGGGPTGSTNGSGEEEITLSAGSGNGTVGLCADGVVIAQFEVRSPDVSGAGIGEEDCDLPTATSYVDSFDCVNEVCGFEAMAGAVVAGVSQWWDLNDDGYVDTLDTDGWLEKEVLVGGVAQHTGHYGNLSGVNSCNGTSKMLVLGGDEERVGEVGTEARGGALEHARILAALKRDFAVVPNPSPGAVTILWSSRYREQASVEVFDVTGRRIRVIPIAEPALGVHAAKWNGRDSAGRGVASGVYFARLNARSGTRIEKFVLLR